MELEFMFTKIRILDL